MASVDLNMATAGSEPAGADFRATSIAATVSAFSTLSCAFTILFSFSGFDADGVGGTRVGNDVFQRRAGNVDLDGSQFLDVLDAEQRLAAVHRRGENVAAGVQVQGREALDEAERGAGDGENGIEIRLCGIGELFGIDGHGNLLGKIRNRICADWNQAGCSAVWFAALQHESIIRTPARNARTFCASQQNWPIVCNVMNKKVNFRISGFLGVADDPIRDGDLLKPDANGRQSRNSA